ncbi:hypothetical protein [Streptococcus sp.]
MSEKERTSNFSMKWEIGLFSILCLTVFVFPILTYYGSPVYLFLDSDSVFLGEYFHHVVNSYFTVSIVLLFVLPVIASSSNYFLEKTGYPFLASLQSFLIFISCFVILQYAMFSLTTQMEKCTLNIGTYLVGFNYLLHIYSDLKDLRKMIEQRNCSTEKNRVEE